MMETRELIDIVNAKIARKKSMLESITIRMQIMDNERNSENVEGRVVQPMLAFSDYYEILRLAQKQLRRELTGA